MLSVKNSSQGCFVGLPQNHPPLDDYSRVSVTSPIAGIQLPDTAYFVCISFVEIENFHQPVKKISSKLKVFLTELKNPGNLFVRDDKIGEKISLY